MNRRAQAARHRGFYFQFPLCAFAFGTSDKERFGAIISLGLMKAGERQWQEFSETQRQEFLEKQARAGKLPRGFHAPNPSHLYAVCGADKTNVTLRSLNVTLMNSSALDSFCRAFEERHGRDPVVRLKSDLVFEARDGGGIAPRELALLAAIFSVVGNKQWPVLITQARIRCRALGYKTSAVQSAEFPNRKDGAQVLTPWQLRTLLDRLHRRKFFARATYGCRQTFYSHRMTDRQLRKAIIESKTFGFAHKMLSRHDDRSMTTEIHNFRAASEGKPPPVPGAEPFEDRSAIIVEDVF